MSLSSILRTEDSGTCSELSGTGDEPEKEMKRIIGILSKDEGYIISSTHAIPNDIPTENVLKFVDVCKNQKQEW